MEKKIRKGGKSQWRKNGVCTFEFQREILPLGDIYSVFILVFRASSCNKSNEKHYQVRKKEKFSSFFLYPFFCPLPSSAFLIFEYIIIHYAWNKKNLSLCSVIWMYSVFSLSVQFTHAFLPPPHSTLSVQKPSVTRKPLPGGVGN